MSEFADLIGGQSYKDRHEEFVTGLTGGPMVEIYLVTGVTIVGYLSWASIRSWGALNQMGPWNPMNLAIDFALNWLVTLYAVTLYSSHPITLGLLIGGPGVITMILGSNRKSRVTSKIANGRKKTSSTKDSASIEEYLPKKDFLTLYRGYMMILTCIAILAVDFKIFPRRFAKVETWGTSLMDLGVGSFVFSMGLVSSRRVLKNQFVNEQTRPLFFASLLAAIKESLSVLLLGIIRLAAVKYFNYQEHITEYGVHWNFFITLGLLPPVVSAIKFAPKWVPTAVVALIISGVYEIVLNETAVLKYIITAPRTDVFSMNREGFFSFWGYLSIFLSGQSTGYYVLPSVISKSAILYPQTSREYQGAVKIKKNALGTRKIVSILLISSASHAALYAYFSRTLTPSRRLANLPYMLWTVSYNTAFLALIVLTNCIFKDQHPHDDTTPLSLEAVNTNGLFMFLMANVLTGLINMNVHTLDCSSFASIGILTLYIMALFSCGLFLYKRNIVIKI